MAFRSQVHHGIRPVLCEYAVEFGSVANIHLLKSIARIIGYLSQRFQIAGISQLIDIDDRVLGVLDNMTDNGRTDKARAAGNEDSFFVCGLHLIPVSVGVAADPTPRILHYLRKAAFGFPACLLFGIGRIGKETGEVAGTTGFDLVRNAQTGCGFKGTDDFQNGIGAPEPKLNKCTPATPPFAFIAAICPSAKSIT